MAHVWVSIGPTNRIIFGTGVRIIMPHLTIRGYSFEALLDKCRETASPERYQEVLAAYDAYLRTNPVPPVPIPPGLDDDERTAVTTMFVRDGPYVGGAISMRVNRPRQPIWEYPQKNPERHALWRSMIREIHNAL